MSSPEFIINSSTRFEWVPGAGVKLMQSEGVYKEIDKHTKKIYDKAMRMTPQGADRGWRNENYYYETIREGRLNVYHGHVWCGNTYSMLHNMKYNTLIKAMS